MHPLGRPLPVTKSPRSQRPPPNVEHLAANGRATVACPPDGPARPRLRARRRQPQVAAHCSRSTRAASGLTAEECARIQPNYCNCGDDYAPVCGVDGKTYYNACYAETCADVAIAHDGPCLGPGTTGWPNAGNSTSSGIASSTGGTADTVTSSAGETAGTATSSGETTETITSSAGTTAVDASAGGETTTDAGASSQSTAPPDSAG